MTNEVTTNTAIPEWFSKAAQLRLQTNLTGRFGAYLKPGERVLVNIEQEDDFVYAQFQVMSADKVFCLDLEAAVIAQDQTFEVLQAYASKERLEIAFDFLRGQLQEFFRNHRKPRFHIDWRLYPFEEASVRFRGRHKSPGLEAMADALLGPDEDD